MTTAATVQTSSSGTSYVTSTISGIDTQALITAAVNAKLVPATRLSDQITTNTNIIAAYQNIQAQMTSLQTDLKSLRSVQPGDTATHVFTSKQATSLSSDSTTPANILTASVDSTALDGVHKVIVTKLAQALTVTSAEQNSSAAALGYTGTFDIGEDGKTASTITISATSSLQDIVNAINTTTTTSGVKADILQAADGKYKLVLSGADTGKNIDITNITGTDVLTGMGVTDSSGSFLNVSQAAQQAQFSVDGTTILSDSNQISNVLTGFSLNLTNAAPGTTISVTVGNNVSGITQLMQTFVDDYNSLHNMLATYQAVNSDGTTNSNSYLYNDPLTRNMTQNLSQLITNMYGDNTNYQSLGAIGITLDQNNNMVLDTGALTDALTNNFSSVTDFFASNSTTGTTGFADTLFDSLDQYSNSGTGSITNAVANLQTVDTQLQSQVDDIQNSANDFQQQLITKYANLEVKMQSANILKQQVDAILKGSTPDTNN